VGTNAAPAADADRDTLPGARAWPGASSWRVTDHAGQPREPPRSRLIPRGVAALKARGEDQLEFGLGIAGRDGVLPDHGQQQVPEFVPPGAHDPAHGVFGWKSVLLGE